MASAGGQRTRRRACQVARRTTMAGRCRPRVVGRVPATSRARSASKVADCVVQVERMSSFLTIGDAGRGCVRLALLDVLEDLDETRK